jgi:branched-chain amino acid transport system ATP-binding protein
VAYDGDILLAGRSLRGLVPEAIASLGVAHVPQGRGTFVDFTVDQNLTLGGTLLHRDTLVARKAEIYELIPELKNRRGQIAGTMSGGEQQMLAVGRALMMQPKLLLLDEPSFGLAPRIVHRFFEMVTVMRRQTGMAILLVEQHPLLVADFVDTAHLLRNGRIVLSTPGNDPALPEVMWGQQFPTEATPT